MKGKNQRSTIHKANGEAAARIAELEAEVERLRDVENVGLLHVKALGEIERLTGRLLELENVKAERDRLSRMVDESIEQMAELKGAMRQRRRALENVWEYACRMTTNYDDRVALLGQIMGVKAGVKRSTAERLLDIKKRESAAMKGRQVIPNPAVIDGWIAYLDAGTLYKIHDEAEAEWPGDEAPDFLIR